jgi:pyruvate dehydrogenase E1 component alpha subunit
MYDPDVYRDKAEVERWKLRDPVTTFAAHLEAEGVLPKGRLDRMERQVEEDVERAVAYAEAGTLEPVEDLTRFVYSEASR